MNSLCAKLPRGLAKVCIDENAFVEADNLDLKLRLSSVSEELAGALWLSPLSLISSFSFSIFLQKKQKMKLRIYVVPKNNNFKVNVKLNAVLFDNSFLDVQTDLIVKQALGGPRKVIAPVQKVIDAYDVDKGYIDISEHILFFDNAIVNSVPEYSILPGGITQIHGMVIYGLEDSHKYFLYSRGINNIKELFKFI